MAEETKTRYFYKLLKLYTKKVRYEHHCEFLADCKTRDIVPEGLQLHKTANVDSFSDEFEYKWKNVLDGASKDMRDLVYQECQIAIETITQQILDLEERVVEDYGMQVRDESNHKIMEICGKLKESLSRRRRTKIDKLCISNHSRSEDKIEVETLATGAETLAPSSSQIDQLIADIRVEVDNQRKRVHIEDLGPEQNLYGVNALPVDSPLLLMNVASTEGNVYELSSPEWSVRDEIVTPNETSEGNITQQIRQVETVFPSSEPEGLGTMNDRVYTEGLQIVVNLSSRTLTEAESSLLSKGLSFCPTPAEVDTYALKKDVLEFVRRIRLKEYFYKDEDVDGDFSEIPAFRRKSAWCPDKNRDIFLEAYASALEKKIFEKNLNTKNYRNLTKEEQQALENLRKYDDIVIKQADKGSGVVVMDRVKYVAEAMRQLGDVGVYVTLDKDPTEYMIKKVNKRVKKAHSDGSISDSTLDYLLVNSCAKAGRFYLLPKLHKKGCPGRPVISGCGTPTEKISEFVDYHLKPLVTTIPSFVKDTNDFLHKLTDIDSLPQNAILVTIDVVGLYPHIPHNEGLDAIRRALDKRDNQETPTNLIVDLAELVLRNNNFEFDGKHFLQILGTAIGTKMAPAYANLFMDELERRLISQARVKPYVWLRYIDDVFMIWTGTEEELREFLSFINEAHDTIKFTWNWSRESINYLDVQVINNSGKIETDLYAKKTDKHQYLYYTSCHPRKCKESIPYAQAMRLRRICSTMEAFERRAKDLTDFLVARGYKRRYIKQQIHRARLVARKDALAPRSNERKDRIPMVVTYHPGLPNIGGILRELQPLLHCSEKCKKAIRDLPMMAFRRPKSLGDYLVHAKLKMMRTGDRPKGTVKCGNERCQVCDYLCPGDTFTSKNTGRNFSINYELNCNSNNVVYLMCCKVCGIQYVGSTSTKFRLRFNNHKSRLRAHVKLSDSNKERDDLIYKHFNSPGHNGLVDVSIKLIDKVVEETKLQDKEGQWAYRLKTLHPHGLNESDFFFSQNRGTRVRRR